jgi:hypothetical protein
MGADSPLAALPADSFLEAAFLRWVLVPAALPQIAGCVVPQSEVTVGERRYRVDYEIRGERVRLGVELDGFGFHSSRGQFTYDRFRQNDLQSAGLVLARFSYDAVRLETRRCVEQLQELLRLDPMSASRRICMRIRSTRSRHREETTRL